MQQDCPPDRPVSCPLCDRALHEAAQRLPQGRRKRFAAHRPARRTGCAPKWAPTKKGATNENWRRPPVRPTGCGCAAGLVHNVRRAEIVPDGRETLLSWPRRSAMDLPRCAWGRSIRRVARRASVAGLPTQFRPAPPNNSCLGTVACAQAGTRRQDTGETTCSERWRPRSR